MSVELVPKQATDPDRALAGLDALELVADPAPSPLRRLWRAAWPKLAAVGLAVVAWQGVVATHWRPDYVLPGPLTVLDTLRGLVATGEFWRAVAITMQRAGEGFALALVIGSLLGVAVARVRPLRVALGALITGLQTMPSIAWFPLAILLFKLSTAAILFVVVLGAAPSIANGLVTGVDYTPPLLLRAGRVLGARGFRLYRYVVLPASLPSYVAGLKQGWAFAWRSLMAGELLVVLEHKPSIGVALANAREFADAPALLAWMVVILVIGIGVDAVFSTVNGSIRRRWGVVDAR